MPKGAVLLQLILWNYARVFLMGAALKAIKDTFGKRERKPASTEDLLQMHDFILKKFDFNSDASSVCLNSEGIYGKS